MTVFPNCKSALLTAHCDNYHLKMAKSDSNPWQIDVFFRLTKACYTQNLQPVEVEVLDVIHNDRLGALASLHADQSLVLSKFRLNKKKWGFDFRIVKKIAAPNGFRLLSQNLQGDQIVFYKTWNAYLDKKKQFGYRFCFS